MLFYRLLQQSVNTDPHPLSDLVGGVAAHDVDDSKVKRTLVRYPLRLLQNVPGDADAFLYEDGWIQSNPSFTAIDQPDNMIQLRPGVAFAMAKLSGLLKPALKWLWADKVWKSNRQLFQGGLDVQQYLFEDRIPLTRIGPALTAKFGPKCFYCNAAAPQVTRFHVDHVLPLSVTKMNGLANLVLACPPCNSSKSDHLPVLDHVERALGLSVQTEGLQRSEKTLNEIGNSWLGRAV
jgi:HNH endonuclease